MKNKKKLIGIIAGSVLLLAVIIVGIILSGSKSRELKKQISLGQQYLSELNYEQAVATFYQAIELDPYNVAAYIGIADAYLGLEAYEQAKTILEEGIRLFTENGKTEGLSILQGKLDEVQGIIDSKVVILEPLVALLDDVWGKNWMDWTLDDYVKTYHLDHREDLGGTVKHSAENNNGSVGTREVIELENVTFLAEMQLMISQEETGGNIECWNRSIQIGDGYRRFDTILNSDGGQLLEDQITSFAKENELISLEGVLKYLRLSGDEFISEESLISIWTDLGNANVKMYSTEMGKEVEIVFSEGNSYEVYSIRFFEGMLLDGATVFQIFFSS